MGDLNGLEIFFVVCAAVGGAVVVIRLILQMIGADHELGGHDVDASGHDLDIGGSDAHEGFMDHGFHLLTMQGIASFFMMFGLVGLAMYRESEVNVPLSILTAVVAGIASMWIIAKIFSMGRKLQSSGTLDISRAVGSEGTVYLTIPKAGTGRVMVNVCNRMIELDGQASNWEQIPTGEPIRVVEVNGNVLIVERI